MFKNRNNKNESIANAEGATQTLYKEFLGRMEFIIAIKAGVAAALSLYLGVGFAKILNRPDYLLSGTWSVMSTFVVMQAHLGGTYRAAWVRFLGVLIGSIMGSFFTSIFGSNAFTLGVSVILTVLVCSMFQLKESIRLACLSVSIVMIMWSLHPSISPWKFGLFRFLDSSLGIGVAVIVSHMLWPTRAMQKLRLNIAKTLHYINRLFQLELDLNPPPKHFYRIHHRLIRDINQLLDETRHYLTESELELLTKVRSIEDWSNMIDHLENIFESTISLRTFQECNIKKILDTALKKRLTITMEQCVQAFTELLNMLKTGEAKEDLVNLRKAASDLNEELNRFRMTQSTREFERQDVEHFFVFFYNLRTVMEELIKMEEEILALNALPA